MSNWKKDKNTFDMAGISHFDNVPDYVLKYLKNNIKKQKKFEYNKNLAGHIKKEYNYEGWPIEINNFFVDKIFENKLLKFYLDKEDKLTKDVSIILHQMWCNYMKKYEFNPVHDHGGVFSFIIFLKIPYDLNKEDSMFPVADQNRQTSRLQFLTINPILGVTTVSLNVDKSYENKMIMFPSSYKHLVYPFYTSNEERITVSGNLRFLV